MGRFKSNIFKSSIAGAARPQIKTTTHPANPHKIRNQSEPNHTLCTTNHERIIRGLLCTTHKAYLMLTRCMVGIDQRNKFQTALKRTHNHHLIQILRDLNRINKLILEPQIIARAISQLKHTSFSMIIMWSTRTSVLVFLPWRHAFEDTTYLFLSRGPPRTTILDLAV